jgi:hypothetical protein
MVHQVNVVADDLSVIDIFKGAYRASVATEISLASLILSSRSALNAWAQKRLADTSVRQAGKVKRVSVMACSLKVI